MAFYGSDNDVKLDKLPVKNVVKLTVIVVKLDKVIVPIVLDVVAVGRSVVKGKA